MHFRCLVAILKEFEAKMMAKLDSLASWMDDHQAKTEANCEELMDIMKASQEKIKSPDGCQPRTDEGLPRSGRGQEQMEAEIKTDLEEMKATESEDVVELQKVPNGQAAVENIRALEDQSGNQ
jgi:hypothetical protein